MEKRGGLELDFLLHYSEKWCKKEIDTRNEVDAVNKLISEFEEDSINGISVFYCNLFPNTTEFALALDAFGKKFKNSGSVVINYAKPTIDDGKECFVTFEVFKKKPKWLYRLEANDPNNGLWYDSNGEYCFGIGSLEGCKTKDLPMGYDERYRLGGRMWHSSCSKKEDLLHWYSFEDALKLLENGFSFKKYLAREYKEYQMETTFIKESCIGSEDVDIYKLFGVKK